MTRKEQLRLTKQMGQVLGQLQQIHTLVGSLQRHVDGEHRHLLAQVQEFRAENSRLTDLLSQRLRERAEGRAPTGGPPESLTDTDRRRLEFDHLRLQGDLLRAEVASEQARSEGMRLQNEQMRLQNEQGRMLLGGSPTTVGGAGTR